MYMKPRSAADTHLIIIVKSGVGVNHKALKTQGFCGILCLPVCYNFISKEAFFDMSSYVTRKTPGNTEWFRQDRFGMFIHWGLYAMPARHEWVKHNESITEEHYQKYFERFDPDLYDPRDWAKRAKAAGMKYAVLTSKHHEGFCMFDSQYTDYKCTNTPAGRDLVKEYVEAFRAEGLKVGFYYSLIDWHHPHFTIDTLHPRRNDPDAKR